MTDPVFTIFLIIAFIPLLAALRFFKTLENDFGTVAPAPLTLGLLGGIVIALPFWQPYGRAGVTAMAIGLGTLIVQHWRQESEPSDGMLIGALMGAAAALPAVFAEDHPSFRFAQCVIAGAISGYGLTLAALCETRKGSAIVKVTSLIACLGAAMPLTPSTERQMWIVVAAGVPIVYILTIFLQWPDVRAELRHEASLGLIDDVDVRRAAHPILRLGRGGWVNAHAHREFVRLANLIALRKRQQRRRTEETARLYQLEIIKLRMQIQEMAAIDRQMRRIQWPTEDEPQVSS